MPVLTYIYPNGVYTEREGAMSASSPQLVVTILGNSRNEAACRGG